MRNSQVLALRLKGIRLEVEGEGRCGSFEKLEMGTSVGFFTMK
jgi:hypothetical protein